MKKNLLAMAIFFVLIFCMQPVYASQLPTENDGTTGETKEVYTVTVVFDKNGGSGSMANLTISSDAAAAVSLPANAFKKNNFTFDGWNTAANGSGTAYENMADVTDLAAEENDGETITLYAQWKVNAPKIKSIKKLSPSSMKVSFKKNKKAAGYVIEYSTSKKFKRSETIMVKKKASAQEVSACTPGKTYYVRMCSYVKNGGEMVQGDWSKVKKVKMKNGKTIENTKASTSIEADVTLTGSGSGYHAKLVLCTPTSAVSFGLQYDAHAIAPYTGKTMALIENVEHNGAGGQTYTRPGNVEVKTGKTYKLMITINKNGSGDVYLDYKKIGSFHNSGLANQAVYIRVEGAVRLNGDKVNAVFDNIKLRQGGRLENGKLYGGNIFQSNRTITTKKVNAKNKVIMSGTGSGINGDWDSDYANVSGIFQFY